MSSTKVKKIPLYSEKPYDYDWNRKLKNHPQTYENLMWLAHFLLKREFKDVQYYGLENVPMDGGFILAANHANGFDPITITTGFGSRRQMWFMSKEEFFHAFYIRWLLLFFNGFPVKRGEADRESLNFAIRVLEEGYGLVIFPQGTRDRQRKRPEPESASSGVALIAREAKVPVLPVSVHLSSDLNDSHPKCIIRYVELIPYEELGFTEGKRRSKEVKAATNLIMTKIGELWDKDQM